jgi:hypothetical protein
LENTKDHCKIFHLLISILLRDIFLSYAYFSVGFTDGSMNANGHVGGSPNCYGIAANYTDSRPLLALWKGA